MTAPRIQREVTITNTRGLHARAAAKFVKCAAVFDAEVWVTKEGITVSGQSIMGLMLLAAAPGNKILIDAAGRDATAAMAALAALVDARFDEDR